MSKLLSFGGIFTATAVLLQSAPLFLPLGLMLSPLSSLPIAMAAATNASLGLTVFFFNGIHMSHLWH